MIIRFLSLDQTRRNDSNQQKDKVGDHHHYNNNSNFREVMVKINRSSRNNFLRTLQLHFQGSLKMRINSNHRLLVWASVLILGNNSPTIQVDFRINHGTKRSNGNGDHLGTLRPISKVKFSRAVLATNNRIKEWRRKISMQDACQLELWGQVLLKDPSIKMVKDKAAKPEEKGKEDNHNFIKVHRDNVRLNQLFPTKEIPRAKGRIHFNQVIYKKSL